MTREHYYSDLILKHELNMHRMRKWKADCEREAREFFGLDATATDECKADSTVTDDE